MMINAKGQLQTHRRLQVNNNLKTFDQALAIVKEYHQRASDWVQAPRRTPEVRWTLEHHTGKKRNGKEFKGKGKGYEGKGKETED